MEHFWLLNQDIQRLILRNLTADEQSAICKGRRDGICSENETTISYRIEDEYGLDIEEQNALWEEEKDKIIKDVAERYRFSWDTVSNQDLLEYINGGREGTIRDLKQFLYMKNAHRKKRRTLSLYLKKSADAEFFKKWRIWNKYMENLSWNDFFENKETNFEHLTKDDRFFKKYINTQDIFGAAALPVAIYNNEESVAKDLLNAGANVNLQNKNGDTALMVSINKNDPIFHKLLKAGADINHQNRNGYTPLSLAVLRKREDLVYNLINHGTELNIRNKNNETALDIAKTIKNQKIIDMLVAAGAQ